MNVCLMEKEWVLNVQYNFVSIKVSNRLGLLIKIQGNSLFYSRDIESCWPQGMIEHNEERNSANVNKHGMNKTSKH